MLVNKTGKLYIKKPENKGVLKILITKKEEKLGQILIIADLSSKIEQREQIIKRIIAETKYSYFESPTDDPESALENTLQKVNFLISHIVKEEGQTWLKNFSMIVTAIKDNEVHFSKVGCMRAFLAQGKKITDIAGNNIFEEDINPIKAFGNILSGEIKKDETILFSTESTLDYISQEKLRRISIENKPERSVDIIKELLEKAPEKTIFAMLIVKRLEEAATEKEKREELKRSALKPKEEPKEIHPSLEEELPAILKPAEEKIEPKKEPEPVTDEEEEEPEITAPAVQKPKIKKQSEIAKYVKKTIVNLRAKISNEDKAIGERAHAIKNLVRAIKTPLERKKTERAKLVAISKDKKHPATRRKATLTAVKIGIPVLVVLVIGVYLFNNIKKQEEAMRKQRQAEEYILLVGSIKDKMNQAVGSLIYQDKNKAKSLLSETKTAIETLPAETEEQETAKADLLIQNKEYLQLALGIKVLRGVAPIFDWKTLSPELAPSAIILHKNALYTFSNGNNAIFAFKLAEKIGENISATSSGVGPLQSFAGAIDEDLIFYEGNGGIAELKLNDKTISKKDIDISIKDRLLATYSNRLYSLSNSDNQIYKHNKTLTGFSKGDPWIKDGTDAQNAVSFSIDGNIWILKRSGQILKLYTGNSEPFKAAIDPALSAPSKIDASDALTLYVLDPASSRLVAIDKKSGETVSQFTSPDFNDLKDFAIKDSKAYLLNGTQIYEIDLNDPE